MDFIKRRQNDPEYLKSVIDQKQIVIEEQKRKNGLLQKETQSLKSQIEQLTNQLKTQQNASKNEILNLNMAIREQQTQLQAMKHDKSEYQFKINMLKLQIKELQKQHHSQIDTLKNQYESQKQTLHLKINKLEKNLSTISNHYNVASQINNDKLKLIEDANRDLRGFTNQKQQRMIMIQNQQYANEIEFQAKQIQNLLQKNEKLQQEVRHLKTELDLHKGIQNDLVKRSSLAQKLIKQLNKRIRQLQGESLIQQSRATKQSQFGIRTGNNNSQQSSRMSASKISVNKQIQQEFNRLKFQHANLKNHSLYLENMQKVYTQKYQTLAGILAEYLENLIYFREKKEKGSEQTLQGVRQVNLDLNVLKKKDVKQWKTEELQTIIFLLVNQIRPFLSKSSLINFPESKNISISFTQSENKEPVSLPKIAQNYQKTYEKQTSKINSRFKDIPLDISTKILRSNLRQWGSKINYGTNIPSIARARKLKSKSIAGDIDRSGFI